MNPLIDAIAGLLIVAGLAGWLAWHEHAKVAAVQEQNSALIVTIKQTAEARKRDQTVLALRGNAMAAQARETATLKASMAAAAASNAAWAAEPVPKEVQSVLLQP